MNIFVKLFLSTSVTCLLFIAQTTNLHAEKRPWDSESDEESEQSDGDQEQKDLKKAIKLSKQEADNYKKRKREFEEKINNDDDLKMAIALSIKEDRAKKAKQQAEPEAKEAAELKALDEVVLLSQRSFISKLAAQNGIADPTELTQRFRNAKASDFKTLDLSGLKLKNVELVFMLQPNDKQKNAHALNLSNNNITYFFFSPEMASITRIDLSNNKNLKKIIFAQDEKNILHYRDNPVIDLSNTGLFAENNSEARDNQQVVLSLKKRGYRVLTDVLAESECPVCLEDKECGITSCCGGRLCVTCHEPLKECPICRKEKAVGVFELFFL